MIEKLDTNLIQTVGLFIADFRRVSKIGKFDKVFLNIYFPNVDPERKYNEIGL